MSKDRADEPEDQALEDPTEDGVDRTAAVGEFVEEAARLRGAAELQAEAKALADDPDDRSEVANVLSAMKSLRVW